LKASASEIGALSCRSSEQRLDADKDERGRREGRQQRKARAFLARRQSRELLFDEFEIIRDGVQIPAGLIDLSQRERAFVWYIHVMPEDGCSIVRICQSNRCKLASRLPSSRDILERAFDRRPPQCPLDTAQAEER
jgi:hypothetical protein